MVRETAKRRSGKKVPQGKQGSTTCRQKEKKIVLQRGLERGTIGELEPEEPCKNEMGGERLLNGNGVWGGGKNWQGGAGGPDYHRRGNQDENAILAGGVRRRHGKGRGGKGRSWGKGKGKVVDIF